MVLAVDRTGAALRACGQDVMGTCSPLSDQLRNLSSADRNIEGDPRHVNTLLKSDLSGFVTCAEAPVPWSYSRSRFR